MQSAKSAFHAVQSQNLTGTKGVTIAAKMIHRSVKGAKIKAMDYKKISNIRVENIDASDHPDYVDAFILSADYEGQPMTDEQLDKINEDGDFILKAVYKFIS